MKSVALLALCAVLGVPVLSGCSEERARAEEAPRAVKLETVGAHGDSLRRFTATVRQQERVDAAFENGGRIAQILVDVGDHFHKGQVLARLDAETLRLRVQQADANVRSANAQVTERQVQVHQQQALFEDGAASQASLTTATVALELARSQWQVALSDRGLAERALRMAELKAPFDGSVISRRAQAHADVAAGEAVLQLEGASTLQVVANLPESLARTLRRGDTVQAESAGQPISLKVRSISARVESAATVEVLLDVAGDALFLRSGESLLLSPQMPSSSQVAVPLAALTMASDGQSANVFVYIPQQGTLRRRQVAVGRVEGDRVVITAGLKAGEQIVTAGTAFLTDGQQVVPFRSSSRLGAGAQS